MTTIVLAFPMLWNMFSVLDDHLLAALQFLHLFLKEGTSKFYGGTGNNFVFSCVSAVTFDVFEFGKVVSFGF